VVADNAPTEAAPDKHQPDKGKKIMGRQKRMRLDKSGQARITGLCEQVTDAVIDAVYKDARRYCPQKTGHLRRSISKFRAGKSGYVVVSADYWRYVEYRTKKHTIRSAGPWPLRNPQTGQVFGPVVKHPGTKPQPFMRPAIQRTRAL
jgi:HK97 gp10 family phage protein